MKQKYLLFLSLAFLIASCGSDNDLDYLLSYDGENLTAPILDAGVHEAAALFTSNETGDYTDQQLIEVTWYTGPVPPERAEVRVYGPGTNNTPGALLYSANVSNALQLGAWNSHTLATPVNITGEDLWISILVEHTSSQQSIGCDAGPNKTNGDWLLSSSDNNWSTFTARTGESINWNVRGVVSQD